MTHATSYVGLQGPSTGSEPIYRPPHTCTSHTHTHTGTTTHLVPGPAQATHTHTQVPSLTLSLGQLRESILIDVAPPNGEADAGAQQELLVSALTGRAILRH